MQKLQFIIFFYVKGDDKSPIQKKTITRPMTVQERDQVVDELPSGALKREAQEMFLAERAFRHQSEVNVRNIQVLAIVEIY